MIIIDSHLDLAWNALQWNRDLTQSVYAIRAQETEISGAGRGQNTVAFPEMRDGRIALCFGTLLARSTGQPVHDLDYASPQQAYATAQGQLAYYKALTRDGHIRLITTADELTDHINIWEAWEEAGAVSPSPVLGILISMESADPILEPDDLATWRDAGLRVIGPAHYGKGRYCGGTSVEDGFTERGFQLLKQMEQHNIVLDMTHLTDRAFWEAMNSFGGNVLASHNNCRALVPDQRQFDDTQLKAIIKRNGIIGVAFDNWMLDPKWERGKSKNTSVSLTTIVDHIDHICQLAGNANHVGIGSDLDGGFGREQSPHDLDTIADLQKLIPLLEQRGYTHIDIENIMYKNWVRFLQSVW